MSDIEGFVGNAMQPHRGGRQIAIVKYVNGISTFAPLPSYEINAWQTCSSEI
jgi:hypothetical protein